VELDLNWNWKFSAAVMMLGAAAGASAQEVPKDEMAFTEFVASQLRHQPLGNETVVIKGPLTLGIGELQANLDRIFNFCRKNAENCSAEIDRFTRSVAEAVKIRNAPPEKEAVRLAVRPAEYVRQLKLANESKGKTVQFWPLTDDLVILPVLDTPRTIRSLAEDDFKKLELNADQVYQLGLANLQSTLKPLMNQAQVAKSGQIGQLLGDPYESSRLALHDSWAPLVEAQGGVLIVAAPAKDGIFYISEDTPTAIDALRAIVKNVMQKVPNPLSGALLRWTKTGWEPVR
jgi:hypothetical protein